VADTIIIVPSWSDLVVRRLTCNSRCVLYEIWNGIRKDWRIQ